ncbi:MAG: glycoside hydrolase family 31 protein [Myxococcota bacterium]|nr:glycoside hydrolase family 31 protein [Myxococcota bacterium]
MEAGGVARVELCGWRTTEPGEIALDLGKARGELSVTDDGSVRLRAGGGDSLPPRAELALGRDAVRVVPVEVHETSDGLALTHSGRRGTVHVEVSAKPFSLRVTERGGAHLATLESPSFDAAGGGSIACHAHPGERFFGFGESPGSFDKRGTSLRLRNRDAGAPGGGPCYLTVPFFLGLVPGEPAGARGLLLDALGPCRFDVAQSSPDRVSIATERDGLDLTVVPGPTPAEVLGRLSGRVGRPALPPLWSLGHHQSRWSYASEAEVRALATEIRRRRIPTDVIHLDIDYMDGYRVFTWHPRRFPDPKGLVADLAKQGFRVVAIVDPGVKVDEGWPVYRDGCERDVFCRSDDGERYSLRVWPKESALPDFNRSEVRRWWGEQHRPLLDVGVAGIWNDMNEPAGWARDLRLGRFVLPYRKQDLSRVVQSDPAETGRQVEHERVRNVYGQQECRATRAFLESERPGERPFLLTRSGTAGVQSLAAVWTGDNVSRWDDLRASIPTLLNLSLSGVAFCGADIGGFFGSCTPELYARWIQLGALQPFARTHSMWLGRRQEPWRFGGRVEAIAREALELRMRLLPYLYGLFHAAEETGAPVWRPLFYEFPEDAESAAVDDQLMLGPDLLVAPVVERGARQRDVYLPPGRWMTWHDDAQYVGPRRVRVPAPLERLPLFLRAGAIVPTRSPGLHVGETPAEPCVLEVVPGADGVGLLTEDDGVTTGYREGQVALTTLRLWDRAGGRLRLEIGRRQGGFAVPDRTLRVVVRGCPPPRRVTLNGQPVSERDSPPGYRAVAGRLDVSFTERGEGHSLEVEPAP